MVFSNKPSNKNQNGAYGSSDALIARPFAGRYVYLKVFVFVVLNAILSISQAQVFDGSCDIPFDKLPEAPQIEIVMSDCFNLVDGPLECWNGLRFKKNQGKFTSSGISVEREQDPKAYFELSSFPHENEEYLGARFNGELAFLEGLIIYSSYDDGNGCGIVSVHKMKHNKERNRMDVTVVPPIR